MPETVEDWIRKAEGDFGTALREASVADESAADAVCFHAHQCIEKLMKAVLLAHGQKPPRTHNLLFLTDLLRSACPKWNAPTEDVEWLTRGGVAFRYPGVWADRSHAAKAMEICKRLREVLLSLVDGRDPRS